MSITKDAGLRRAYNKAVKDKSYQFCFDGDVFVTADVARVMAVARKPRPRKQTCKWRLKVVVTASTLSTVQAMIDQLARSACDIANSTDDDEAHISVVDA